MREPLNLADLISQPWAMEPRALEAFLADAAVAQELAPTLMVPSDDEEGPQRKLNVRDGVAHIAINGPMLKRVPWIFKALGIRATATGDVAADIDSALADAQVKAIVLDVDSPGGIVSGVAELGEKVKAADSLKPVTAHVSDMMASAAYWVGSQARSVSAVPSALIGSIGVYNVIQDTSAAAEKAGIKVNVIASAPLKGAGVAGSRVTDAQIEDARRLVMDYAEMFRGAVGRGRRMNPAAVDGVATGQVWIASEAKARGLIDHVEGAADAHGRVAQKQNSTPAIVAEVVESTPVTGATEKTMAEKNEAGAGTPVANEDEIKALRLKAAKAEAMEAQLKALWVDALIAKYEDRIAPAAKAGMVKAVSAYESQADAEKWLKSLPVITRAEQISANPQANPAPVAERISDGDKEAMRLIGANSPEHLRSLEKAADLVESVQFDGRAKLKDGRIVTREQLNKLIGYAAALVIGLFSLNASATALSQARMTTCKGTPSVRQYLMKASTTIYAGGLVMVNSSGTVEPATASASNAGVAGVSQETKTSAASGSYWINVASGLVCKFVGTSLAQTAVGDVMYCSDDQTFDETQGSNEPVCGILVHYVSSTSGWILVDGGINMGRINTITSPVILTADLTLANAEVIDNDTNGTVYFKGAGQTNNEDLGIDLETTANAATLVSSTGVVKIDFAATGATLQLSNDQIIGSGTNEQIEFGDTEHTSLAFGTPNEVTVGTDSGVTRWDFEAIGVKTAAPLMLLKEIQFCGNGANATTAWYDGPHQSGATDWTTGGAACDGNDSADEGTADAVVSAYAAIKVVGMACEIEAGGADDVYTFQLRASTADVTGVTCNVTLDGAAPKGCSVILDAPVTVAANAPMAVKGVAATDDNMSAKDVHCSVFSTF